MTFFWLYLITLPTLAVIDLAWIVGVAQSFYKTQLGTLLATNTVWWAAVLFYLIYVAGLVFFVIQPAIEKKSLSYAILAGAFFGLIAYGTYDLTNLATTTNWPLTMSLVDMAWGTIAGGAISGAVFYLATAVFSL